MVVITNPILHGILFRVLTEQEPDRRSEFIRTVTITVAITLFASALIGRDLLSALGIDLGAFGVAGGLVLALMGAEMLFGGEPSRAQGGRDAHDPSASFEDSAIVPYAIPFVAGPGAIATVIVIASTTDDRSGTLVALVAVAVAVVLLPIGHLLIAKYVKLSETGIRLTTRLGGLLILTIAFQLGLSGIQSFFDVG